MNAVALQTQFDADATMAASPRGELLAGVDGVEATETALVFDPGTPVEAWQRVLCEVVPLESRIPWWVGDALVFGVAAYGRDVAYRALEEATGRASHTLENRVSVSRSVRPGVRRDDLSWSHHRAVAGLKDEEEQREWLARAADRGWPVATLARQLRDSKTETDDGGDGGDSGDVDLDDAEHEYRCPCCGHEWSGPARPEALGVAA